MLTLYIYIIYVHDQIRDLNTMHSQQQQKLIFNFIFSIFMIL